MSNKKIEWQQDHANIFAQVIEQLNNCNIKYFILRNYEGLPFINTSKDVDIIIEPGSYKVAADALSYVYDTNKLLYKVVKYERVRCWYGYNLETQFSIHLDLIEGYINKGFEIFDFDELYKCTINYKNFQVLEPAHDAVMLLYYKLVGTGQLEDKYRLYIKERYDEHRHLMRDIIFRTIDKKQANSIIYALDNNDYDSLVRMASKISVSSKKKVFFKKPLRTIKGSLYFLLDKLHRIIVCPRKFQNFITVQGADGTGKTTFINGLIKDIDFYFNSDGGKSRVYHFRPTMLPNLGAMGEKAGVMKEDKDFTNPHRRKPAGKFSSFARMCYYWLDYVVGVPIILRKNARFDNFTIFDRYIYDFIVDPYRSRINLPDKIRRIFAKMVIQPRIVFVLLADADTIYARKQELTREEINRQLGEFRKLAQTGRHFFIVDANKSPEEMIRQAIEIILNEFSEK
jgi:thymidylate kinase